MTDSQTWRSVFCVLPMLLERNLSATAFVATSYISGVGKRRDRLSWRQISELAGVEIGAHGHDHVQMDLVNLDVVNRECTHSKVLLEQHLGRALALPLWSIRTGRQKRRPRALG